MVYGYLTLHIFWRQYNDDDYDDDYYNDNYYATLAYKGRKLLINTSIHNNRSHIVVGRPQIDERNNSGSTIHASIYINK